MALLAGHVTCSKFYSYPKADTAMAHWTIPVIINLRAGHTHTHTYILFTYTVLVGGLEHDWIMTFHINWECHSPN